MFYQQFSRNGEHLANLFEHPELIVNKVASAIKKHFPECDCIAGNAGISSAAVVMPIALKMKKPFVFARTKKSHSHARCVGHTGVFTKGGRSKRFSNIVVIDDFMETGTSLTDTVGHISEYLYVVPAGIVLYSGVCPPQSVSRKNRLKTEEGEFVWKSASQKISHIPIVTFRS